MGKIIINRETNYYSCISTFGIYLDDKKIDTLKNGQVKEFVISNGKHEIYVKNILDKSNILKIFIDKFTTIYIDCKMGILNPKLSIKKEISTESNLDRYQLLDKLNELKKKKVISEEEYEKEKNKIFKTDIEENVEKDTKDKKKISIPKNKIECENCHKFNSKKRKYCWLCGKELDNTIKVPIENKEIPTKKKNKALLIIGIILSIVSGLTCLFGNVGIFFSTISLILRIVILTKGKNKKGIGIIILSGFTLFIAICISIILSLTVSTTKAIAEENLSNKEDNTIVENETNKEENEAVKKVDTDNIEDDRDLDSIVDDTMINQFISLGFNIEEATEMQYLFYQMGIKSLSNIHSGANNPDINNLVAFVAIANNNEKQKFYFTIENRKMFYAGFKSEDLYDSEKGGVLKNINDVHIPETKITLEEYSLLQVLAQDEVKKYLNYPSTASFPLYDGWNAGRSDNNYKVIGKVSAKNGFGVSSKISFSVYFIKDGENFTVDAVEIDGNRVK